MGIPGGSGPFEKQLKWVACDHLVEMEIGVVGSIKVSIKFKKLMADGYPLRV